tara:strand:+ start:16 stop:597 length:582 start_codon:yes stop_codon:yes gene_type:complete
MPMPAVLGTIAQQGQSAGGGGGGGSAPTSVSTATSSTGNYDNALIVYQDNAPSNTLASNDGSTFSSTSVNIEFGYNNIYSAALNGNSGIIVFGCQGYIRATGATSFQWAMKNIGANDATGALNDMAITGTASTDQDETSGNIGHFAAYEHNSGGRGYLLMNAGDDFTFNVDSSATNSSGTTDSSALSINIEVA